MDPVFILIKRMVSQKDWLPCLHLLLQLSQGTLPLRKIRGGHFGPSTPLAPPARLHFGDDSHASGSSVGLLDYVG